MDEVEYIDLEILAEVAPDEDYVLTISKKDLNTLVSFDERLVVRHWNGDKPVRLCAYGNDAVRTESDATEGNNLSNLSQVDEAELPR